MRLAPPLPVCDDAEFSADGLERLWLSRKVTESGPLGMYIGLNPSRAGAARTETDHTITKGIGFAERWGWRGFWMGNLFTHIETHSAKLKQLRFETAVGQGDCVLEAMLPFVDEIVVCWGAAVPKHMRMRVHQVIEKIRMCKRSNCVVWCFGRSKENAPLHPLMLGYDTQRALFLLPNARPSRRDDE